MKRKSKQTAFYILLFVSNNEETVRQHQEKPNGKRPR